MSARTVYLVEDLEKSPGQIISVFNSKDDAKIFASIIPQKCKVVPRTVHYGQPPMWGYNR